MSNELDGVFTQKQKDELLELLDNTITNLNKMKNFLAAREEQNAILQPRTSDKTA